MEFTREEFGQHFPNVSAPAVLGTVDMEYLGLTEIPDPVPVVPEPVVPPPLTPEEQAAAMQFAILNGMTNLFDAIAQSKNYDNRITCAMRAGYPGPFQAEGIAFATWMDTQNAKAYAMLAEVQAGTRQMPATVPEALDLLDPMVWPTP